MSNPGYPTNDPYQQQGYGQGYPQQQGFPQQSYPQAGSYAAQSYSGGGYPQDPVYGGYASGRPSVTFGQAMKLGLKNWTNFSGRASRSEFWWWYLGVGVASTVLQVVLALLSTAVVAAGGENAAAVMGIVMYGVMGLFGLAVVIPTLSLWVRRLHDTNQPGMWLLLHLACLGIVPFIMAIMESNPAGARFDDPSKPLYGPQDL
ncbi:MAG: DUF805 domain-containing protein [Actinomycetia bacterium]|nr:DUF805 domain-containing protein [Actinomycetes bacterium]